MENKQPYDQSGMIRTVVFESEEIAGVKTVAARYDDPAGSDHPFGWSPDVALEVWDNGEIVQSFYTGLDSLLKIAESIKNSNPPA